MKAILALAAAATALASAAAAMAEELGATPAATPPGDEPAATPRRGRPAKNTEPEAPKGKTYEELQELIAPFVEDGKGEQVKKIIGKHTGGGTLKDLAAKPENQAAFEKDLNALAF